jgi:hypothetical protein
MKGLLPLLGPLVLLSVGPLRADSFHQWAVTSPNHAQTFTFGSERHRAWLTMRGHLAVAMNFTNDPYVDQDNPRRYDDFIFNFPNVVLGNDGRTFYYHPPDRAQPVAVATREHGFFGDDVRLLPSSFLEVQKPHGFLTLTLLVAPGAATAQL